MRKNLFDLFIDKVKELPLWVRQVIYLKLKEDMKENSCEDFLNKNYSNLFSLFVPTITYEGKTELLERKCGLDINIYNLLKMCSENYSILEISLNSFLTVEEVAKHFMFCVEQTYIKKPDSVEVYAMAGFIAGKFRTGEYLKRNGTITTDQWLEAIEEQKRIDSTGKHLPFGEVLITMDFVKEEDIKSLFVLKEEAKKRFILDYSLVPKAEVAYANVNEAQTAELEKLKKENETLKKKLVQLLQLVKKNA